MDRNIKIVDSGLEYYTLEPCDSIILGRMYDNDADTIVIERPEAEKNSVCTMIITNPMGSVVDHIIMENDKYNIKNVVSQNSYVKIGFSFSRQDGYIKNTAIIIGSFLSAQKPDGFVPVEPEQKKNLDYLVSYGFTDSKLVGNELQFFNMNGDKVVAFDLSPFTQEQSDLGELDASKETFVKGKKTSNLTNDGDGASPFATEQWVTEHGVGVTIDTEMSDTSTNPVQNKVIKEYVDVEVNTINQEIDSIGTSISDTNQKVEQLNSQVDGINNKLNNKANLNEENNFTGINKFNAETQFNGTIEIHNNDININNGVLKTTNENNDIVTKYAPDKITITKNGDTQTNELELPNKSGILATTDDINEKVGFKYTKLKNVDINNNKEDAIITEDTDASISMYHQNGTTQAGITASKSYVEMATVDTSTEKASTAKVALSSEVVTIETQDTTGKGTKILVSPDDISFNDRPKVKDNGNKIDVAIKTDLDNYIPTQSENGTHYSQVNNENGQFSVHISKNGDTADLHNLIINKDGVFITSKVKVQGDAEVSGSVTVKETETLKVKDNIVITNADGIDLVDMSGLGIRKNSNDTYGIVYDPASDSVKLGLGKLDTTGKFTFNEGEGQPVAVRDDSSLLVDGHLIKWDATNNKFVDCGKDMADIATANTIATRTADGALKATAIADIDIENQTDDTVATKKDIKNKQDKLTAGTNITIEGSTISSSEPIAEAIRDNTVQIEGENGSLLIGGANTSYNNNGVISIGKNAKGDSSRNYTIAIGGYAYAKGGISIGESSQSTDGVTIGYLAKGTATDTIQLGSGTNSTANSFQINDDNIYKTKTHTLTVQNIEQDGNPVYGILSGNADPTTETVGKQFQFYVNTASKKLFQCMAVTTTTEEPIITTYEWQTVGDETLAKQIQNNEIQIKNSNGGFQAGGNNKGALLGGSIGNSSNTANGGSVGYEAVSSNGGAVGSGAKAGHGGAIGWGAVATSGFAGGYNAKTVNGTTNINAVQLGTGTNAMENSLQIYDDNIYNANTHTLTVRNAQVNGNNVYGVLQGETDPTEATVGAVGQCYLNTTTQKYYICVSDANSTYTWKSFAVDDDLADKLATNEFNIYVGTADACSNTNGDFGQCVQIYNKDGTFYAQRQFLFDKNDFVQEGDDANKKYSLASDVMRTSAITDDTGTATDKVISQKGATDNFVPKKTAETGILKAYCVNGEKSDDVCSVSMLGEAGAIARYNGQKQLCVTVDPTDINHVTRKKYVDDNKVDKTGGTISGNLAIQGNLTVTGETTTEKQKTLDVEDNFIYTNANKVELTALLSGLAIYKNGTDIYAIAYDPATDSVKLGLGTRDEQGVFHFNTGEGSPVAVRADSADLTDNHIIIWDATNHKLIDSGKTLDDLAKKTGATFTGNIVLNSDTAIQSQSVLSTNLQKFDLMKRNEKGYVEVGNSEDELQLFGNLSMPTYNGNYLALKSDVTAALNVRTILNTQTLTADKGSWYNQFATITPIWDGSTYKKQYDFYGSIGSLGQGTVTITVPVTMSSLRNLTCGSSGEWKNWERVNAVRIAFTSNTTFAITISDDQGSAHNVDFHLTFIND